LDSLENGLLIQIELRSTKALEKGSDILISECDHNIQIMGGSGLTLETRCDRLSDHVLDAMRIEHAYNESKGFEWGHGLLSSFPGLLHPVEVHAVQIALLQV
jgi:hypothetical protein